MKIRVCLVAALTALAVSPAAQARDYISVVGFSTPKIESTGSGGGMKLFCSGIGVDSPDITNSSRRMKASEFKQCQNNGVTDVVEVLIGYDGIAFANSVDADQLNLELKDIFLALAKDVPNPDGSESLVPNPYMKWSEINPELPDLDIEVLGPPPTSGTRDAFAELALEGGCKTFDFIKAMKSADKNQYKAVCHTMREDGLYVEAGENDNLIVQKLQGNPDALGIFGYSFLEQNDDVVQSSVVAGFEAEFDAIADGDYPISRPLYFYVKKQHVGTVPGIAEYLAEFTKENTWGEDGYLADKGMIPLNDELRESTGEAIRNLEVLDGIEDE